MSSVPDQRALNILLNAYWTTTGWRDQLTVTNEDLAYAVDAGYLFPLATVTHDEAVRRILAIVPTLDPIKIANSFLASLSTRRLDIRSALGSYAVARNMPDHPFQNIPYRPTCRVCGAYYNYDDFSVLNFERFKWGGVRHLDPFFIAFDLEQYARLELPPQTPTEEDLRIFRAVIDTACSVAPSDGPNALVRALSPVLKSNENERRVLIETLGYCGILQDPVHPGFASGFVLETQRSAGHANSDWHYPIAGWRGRHGVNQSALAIFFPAINFDNIK